eukprot:m.132776 g.132776  ORF g.132776 m.132776 type:complete len:225 (-) comp13092_c0_seq23:123-797(-)
MPTMTTSPSLCLKTLMKTTIPFSSFTMWSTTGMPSVLFGMGIHFLQIFGTTTQLRHCQSLTSLTPSSMVSGRKLMFTCCVTSFLFIFVLYLFCGCLFSPILDERTWEYVVYDGYLSSAIFLAMSFEEKARNSKNKQAFLTNMEYAYKVYSFWLEHIESKLGSSGIPAYWHKNFGIVANALFDETKQSQYLEARNREWLAYTTSGQQDDQIPAIKGMLRQSGVKI